MKYLIILLFALSSCTSGIKITQDDYTSSNDSFHKVQAKKIIEHTDKYKPKEARVRKKEKKYNFKVAKYNSKKKIQHSKRLASSNHFNFH